MTSKGKEATKSKTPRPRVENALGSAWWVRRNKANSTHQAFELLVTESETKCSEYGYIFTVGSHTEKSSGQASLTFACSDGSIRLSYTKIALDLCDVTLQNNPKSVVAFTRNLQKLIKQNPPPPAVVSTPRYKDAMAALEKTAKQKENVSDNSQQMSNSQPIGDDDYESERSESERDDEDNAMSGDVEDSGEESEEVPPPLPVPAAKPKPPAPKSTTKLIAQPLHPIVPKPVPNSQTNTKTVQRTPSSSAPKAKKPIAPPKTTTASHATPITTTRTSSNSGSSSSSGGSAARKTTNQTRSNRESQEDNDEVVSMDEQFEPEEDEKVRTTYGLTPTGKEWLDVHTTYHVGTFYIDPLRLKAAPVDAKVRAVSEAHSKVITQRILNDPRAVVPAMQLNVMIPFDNIDDFNLEEAYERGMYPFSGCHSAKAYADLRTTYPNNKLFWPRAEIYNGLPTVWICRMGVKHNEDNAFRREHDFEQKITRLRELWVNNSRQWTKELKCKALEAIGVRAADTMDLRPYNELFQMSSAPDELWSVYRAMLDGDYVSAQRKRLRERNTMKPGALPVTTAVDDPEMDNLVNVDTQDAQGSSKRTHMTARQDLLRTGALPRGTPITAVKAFRPLLSLSINEALRLGKGFINGCFTAEEITNEAGKMRVLTRIRDDFKKVVGCATWAEVTQRYRYAASDSSLLQWRDAFQAVQDKDKRKRSAPPEQFVEWAQGVKRRRLTNPTVEEKKLTLLTLNKSDAQADLHHGTMAEFPMALGRFRATLILYFPSQPKFEQFLPLTNIEEYMAIVYGVKLMNTCSSYLLLMVCPLQLMNEIKQKVESQGAGATVRLACVTFTNSPGLNDEWQSPSLGLVYVWFGNAKAVTNNIALGFESNSLSFVSTLLGARAYKDPSGRVLDPCELHPALCRALVFRHTSPGETVLDLCAGVGAFCVSAFLAGRNVIAVEQEEGRYRALTTRMHACVEFESVDNEDLRPATPPPDMSDITVTPAPPSTSIPSSSGCESDKPKKDEDHDSSGDYLIFDCVSCGKKGDAATEGQPGGTCVTCERCRRPVHPGCLKEIIENGVELHLCSPTCAL